MPRARQILRNPFVLLNVSPSSVTPEYPKYETDEHFQHDQVDKSLKALIIPAVDEACIRCLRHKYVGHSQVTTF